MGLRLGLRWRRSCVQSGPLLERVNITMNVTEKLIKFYLEHGFLVKWAGTDVEGLVSSSQAKEECPQQLIAFYESRLTFYDIKNLTDAETVTAMILSDIISDVIREGLEVNVLKYTNLYNNIFSLGQRFSQIAGPHGSFRGDAAISKQHL